MRTVFNNQELAHVWAQQGQLHGKGSSMFFEGRVIYSYGHHFPIACFYDDLVLFTAKDYSTTTARHKSITRSAISGRYIIVPKVTEAQIHHIENIDFLLSQHKELSRKAVGSRKHGEFYVHAMQDTVQDLGRYIKHFNITPTKDVKKLIKTPISRLLDNKAMEKIKAQIKTESAARRKANAEAKTKELEALSRWQNGDTVQNSFRNLPIALRILDGMVETTQGAKVSITSAKQLWQAIKEEKPLHDFKIDYYTVQGIINGFLVAGCHKIPMTEINRIGALL